jgi:uncharacterized protein with HEPN domain
MAERDIMRLREILWFCAGIAETLKRFGNDREAFLRDRDYFDSVCMKLLQIGECSNQLSDAFKEQTGRITTWTGIRGLRNLVAHEYGELDGDLLWEIATQDIPALKRFCEQTIAKIETL